MNTRMDTDPFPAKTGTVGGTLFVLLIELSVAELVKTTALAALGALVSFSVSTTLKWILKKLRQRK